MTKDDMHSTNFFLVLASICRSPALPSEEIIMTINVDKHTGKTISETIINGKSAVKNLFEGYNRIYL